MKKLLISMLVVLICVTGCGKVPKLENGQDAVVTLKGKDISVDSLYEEIKDKYALSVLIDMMDTQILNDKYEDKKLLEKKIIFFLDVFHSMLYYKFIEKVHYPEQKEDIKAQIEAWISQFGNEATLLQQTYSAWGIDTMDELEDYLKLQYKRNLAIEDYAKEKVSDDEINKFYEETIFGDITAKHILIKPETKDNMTEDEITKAEEEALKQAKEIITKLKNGEDFSKLAKENSDDEATASKGGELSAFTHGTMTEEFEEAAKKLEKGKYTTEPVKTTYGYHIIYKVKEDEKPKLKVVKDDIIEELAQDKLTEDATLQITALEELRKDYKIEIQDKNLKTQYETYLTNAKTEAKESK